MKRQGPGWSKFAQRVCRPLSAPPTLCGGVSPPPEVVEVCGRAKGGTVDRRLDSPDVLGVTGNNKDIEYMGATVWLRPSEFQQLAPVRTAPFDHVRAHVARKLPLGNPMLYLDVDAEHGVARVTGHEGRGRMLVTAETVGDQPVPVHVIVRKVAPGSGRDAWTTYEVRARNWKTGTVAALDCVVPESRARALPRPVRGLFQNGVVGTRGWAR